MSVRKHLTHVLIGTLLSTAVAPAFGQSTHHLPIPPEDPLPGLSPELFTEVPSGPGSARPWVRHDYEPVGLPGMQPRVTRLIDLPAEPPPPASVATSPPQDYGWRDPEQADRPTPPGHNDHAEDPPQIEGLQQGFSRALQPGAHVREFEGEDWTGTFPPDTVVAVGSHHVVEAVNRGITVFNKLGTEVQSYRSFNTFFSPPSGWSLFDPKIVWSPFHNKFALLVLARNTATQDSRFYLAISRTHNALGDWWWWWYDAESLGDSDAWLDFASLGTDPFGLYVTGNMLRWGGGNKYAKLWAISPQAWNGGPANSWVWLDLQWPGGTRARSIEVAHAHTLAWDAATFMVNTYDLSGSDALLWRIVGDRASGAGLLLSRFEVDIDDYDEFDDGVAQPGGVTRLRGGRSVVGNAVYVNRNVFFTLATDVGDDGSSGGLLTYRINIDSRNIVWSDLHWSGDGRYYIYPALSVRGGDPDGSVGVFYSYVSVPEGINPSSGFKLFTNQPANDDGPNQLYQLGLDTNVRLDGQGRNRWGDYSGAAYDWQCGHLWGATEYAGLDSFWRTRIKAISANGEDPCPSSVSVTFPEAVKVNSGSTHQVQWDLSGVPSHAQIVIFYDDGETIVPISPFLPPTARSFAWTVPSQPTPKARVNVAVWDGQRYLMSDWSDFPFEVVGPARGVD